MPRGGKRPGAGRPKGSKDKNPSAVRMKEEGREKLRKIILTRMEEMTRAQMASAEGLKYLVARSAKGGRFEPVTREQVDAGIFQRDDVIIEVWDKQPSTQAYTDLMNRALDKPKEQEQEINLGGALVVKWQQ